MEKETKGYKIVIGLLIIVIIGLVGYIIYDKKVDNQVKEPVKQEENNNMDNNLSYEYPDKL